MAAPGVESTGYRESAQYRRRWWTLAVLSLSLVVIGLDNTILNLAIPTLQREFEATASKLQWMVDSYILVFAGLLLTMGALGDRFGRARALQAGLVLFGISSVFAAYAGSSEQLIGARALMGIGGALIMPATLSIISNVFPREERGRAISVWAAVAGLGIGLGPVVGGLLLEFFWWGSVFFINIPIVAAALLAGLALVPNSQDPAKPSLDVPGAFLSIAAVTALVFAIIEAPARGWTDGLVLAAFGASVLLGIAFAYRELRTREPMLNLRFFKNPRFSGGAGAIAIGFFSLFGVIFGLTQYLQFVKGFTPLEAGLGLIPVALGMMAGAGSSSRVVERVGATRVVAAGLLIVAAVLVSINLWGADTPYWALGISFFILAFGMGNTMAPSTDAVMGAVPERNAGVASATNDVTRQVSGALGVAAIGSVMNTIYSERVAGAVTALPPEAAAAVRDSVGAAVRIGEEIGGPGGALLIDTAREDFTIAFGLAALLAAGMATVGAVLVARFLPPQHLPVPGDESPGEAVPAPAAQESAD